MDIRTIIYNELTEPPKFITTELEKLIWYKGILVINIELFKLITKNILSARNINNINKSMGVTLDLIYDISNTKIQMQIITYYSKLLIYLETITIEYEFFEATQNIKNFCEKYYELE